LINDHYVRRFSNIARASCAFALTGACFLACSSTDSAAVTPIDTTDDDRVGSTALTTDSGPLPPPLDLSGVAPGTWGYFDFPGVTFCRDGSAAGIAVNPSPSGLKKVMFFFEGGGACFDAITCAANGAKVYHKSSPPTGVFDRSNPDNPFADYTHVLVPYCTGDVHAGNKPNGSVANVGPQKFVGYTNTEYFLKKIAATFPDTERLAMTGESAGGFGANANYAQALRIFPSIPVNLVDDSGPFMRSPALATCLQKRWKDVFGFDNSIIAECGADCVGQANYFAAAAKHSMAKATAAAGLISATGDDTIRLFFGYGTANCLGIPISVPVADYKTGLANIKSDLSAYDFGAFIYGGTNHTVLSGSKFYSTSVGGQSAAQWVRGIVDSDTVSNIGP
jgi:hypothetical protein